MGDPEAPQELDQSTKATKENEDEERESESNGEDEEAGECGFCLFMKGGGCKDAFIAWEKCIEEAENNKEDIVEKCFEVTGALKKCMEAHADYYEPILQAEKAQEAEAMKTLDEEKSRKESEPTEAEKKTEQTGIGKESEEVDHGDK